MKPKIKISTQTLFHSLIHFCTISSEVKATLIYAGFTKEQIEAQLSNVGSKFYSNFANSPQEVISIIDENLLCSIVDGVWDDDDRCRLSFMFDHNIGVVNVVKISDLTDQERASISEVYRGDNLIRVATSERIFETNLCQVIVGGDMYNPELITLFPGMLTPPLSMTNYMSDPFWCQYTFIKNSN